MKFQFYCFHVIILLLFFLATKIIHKIAILSTNFVCCIWKSNDITNDTSEQTLVLVYMEKFMFKLLNTSQNY